MAIQNLFIWPRETFVPQSLFKHYVYLGETAGVANKYSPTDVLDLSVQNITRQNFVSKIKNCDYIFMPIEVYTARSSIALIDLIKNYTDAKLVGYGTAIALNPKIFAPHFDYLITSGFYGNAVKDLIQNTATINNKIITVTKNTTTEWGYPLLDKLPVQEYKKISGNEIDLCVQMGCSYNCAFCMEKIFHPGNFIEHRPVEDILKFLDTNIYDKYFFDATTFTANKSWTVELCEQMAKNIKRPLRWRTVSRIDCINDEICSALKMAGCYQIGFGIETLSKDVQKSVHKIITEKRIKQTFATLDKYGIEPRGFFILGLPNQTKADIEYCQDFITKNRINCRWKEYMPLRKCMNFSKIEDFKEFEKDNFFFHPVKGMTKREYLDVLLSNNRYKGK